MKLPRVGADRNSGIAAGLVSVTILTGCAGGVALHERAEVAVITDSGFLTGDEAAISGMVSITDPGCVGIADSDGTVYPTIWPRGTTLVDASTAAIDIPGVGGMQQGDAIRGSGGYYGTEGREVLVEVAERCDWDGEVIGIRFE